MFGRDLRFKTLEKSLVRGGRELCCQAASIFRFTKKAVQWLLENAVEVIFTTVSS